MEDAQKETNVSSKKPHKLAIDGRKSLAIFGVTEILEITSDHLSVRLATDILNIKGSNICTKRLAIDEGVLEATGTVEEIRYAHKKERVPLIKRLFK